MRGADALVAAVRDCMASLFTNRAIVYRAERGFRHRDVALSVGVQKMVRSDLASAGVMFTLDTESGHRGVVTITGSWGLGESVVKGRVNPDEFWVFKPTLETAIGADHPARPRRQGDQARVRRRQRPDRAGTAGQRGGPARRWSSSDEEVAAPRALGGRDREPLLRRAPATRRRWTSSGPRTARAGSSTSSRRVPRRCIAQKQTGRLEVFHFHGTGRVLARGKSVGGRIGVGVARVIRSAAELLSFRDGEVLVAPSTDPDWEPVLKRAAAVVTEQGGRTCHAAIVSRELGLPCVVGTGDATRAIRSGAEVTVSCAEGDEGRVYEGKLPFEREEIDPAALPTPRVPIMLNVGDPRNAFRLAGLPSAGVGLARIEFVVSSWIGIHPMALLHPERVEPAAAAEIQKRTAGWATPRPSSSSIAWRPASPRSARRSTRGR